MRIGVAVFLVLVFSIQSARPEDVFAGPELTLVALERMHDSYVYPDQLKTPILLNAALRGLRAELGEGLELREILGDVSDASAKKIFSEEFEKALRFARSKKGVPILAPAYAATATMLASLGRSHTRLLLSEDMDDRLRMIKGGEVHCGISATIECIDGMFFADRVFPKLFAGRQGLRRFDEVLQVAGRPVSSEALWDLRGKKYSKAELSVRRGGELLNLSISREDIEVFPIDYKILQTERGKILYFSFYSFSDDVPMLLQKLLYEKNPDGLIIDLRGNIGGDVTSLDPCLSMFLPSGATLYFSRSAAGTVDIKNRRTTEESHLPMVILIDKRSKSSAEIFAAVMAEYGRARLVGERSAGEVERARTISLPLFVWMSVTNGEVMTPRGKMLEGTGALPDATVSLTPEHIAQSRDIQFERALEEIRLVISKK